MAEILQHFTVKTAALLKTDDGTVIIELDNVKGSALSITIDGVVAGTGTWTTVLVEAEYSLDNGTTWLAAKDTVFASAISAEVVTSITAIKATDIRLIATTLTQNATDDPDLTLQIEIRVI